MTAFVKENIKNQLDSVLKAYVGEIEMIQNACLKTVSDRHHFLVPHLNPTHHLYASTTTSRGKVFSQ
ncbi:hypothetical protein [Neisseria canis]|uniref:hypothetical protein n=1 Tax=Neisseria canis TaxID=493 RepID=UPI000F822736|nr:hypothetical protein [Neisseria canis]